MITIYKMSKVIAKPHQDHQGARLSLWLTHGCVTKLSKSQACKLSYFLIILQNEDLSSGADTGGMQGMHPPHQT